MKKVNILNLLLLVLGISFFASCEDENKYLVGNWDAMEWKFENVSPGIKIEQNKNTVDWLTEFRISNSGSIDIVCKNYSRLWFSSYPGMFETEEIEWYNFSNDYCTMTIDGNVLHCEFKNIENIPEQTLEIVLTAGDIFYHMHFLVNSR